LVAFGGGGPLHACALAEELHIGRIVVPENPGLFSAQGLLHARLHVTNVHAILRTTSTVDGEKIETVLRSQEEAARASLLEQGGDPATIRFRREYDARYCGQSFELTIAYDPVPSVVDQRFHDAHRARYGYDAPGDVVEIVNARLTATAEVSDRSSFDGAGPERVIPSGVEGRRAQDDKGPRRSQIAAPRHRPLWLDGAFATAAVFQRDGLADGMRIDGPAIVEAYDSTTYVGPRWKLAVDGALLVLQRAAL
jgi:N-methylhydantoinase A